MLPGAIDMMVVIIVNGAYLFGKNRCGITVYASTLVVSADIFIKESSNNRVFGKLHLYAIKHVFPWVLPEHLAMVVEEVFGIGTGFPTFSLIIKAQMPTTELITRHILKIAVISIAAAWNERLPELLEAVSHLLVGVKFADMVGTVKKIPGFAAKLTTHLYAPSQ